jgi:glyoxalase-like protein
MELSVTSRGTALPPVDHLIWGCRDLEREIERVAEWTGVRPASGGRHPGEGTRNAIVALGPEMYLELLGPDPEQPPLPRPRWLGLDTLVAPRLVTWAARSKDLERRAAAARACGVPIGEVRAGRRELSDGQVLSWRLTYPEPLAAEGLVPFLIDWGDSPHPAASAPKGIRLVDLHGEHPDPATITELLGRLGFELRVAAGPTPALVASLETPRGRVELR